MAINIQPPKKWGNLEGIPSDLTDGKISWGEIIDKPIVNCSLPVPNSFPTNTLVDLGKLPLAWAYSASSYFLLKLLIRLNADDYNLIAGTCLLSLTDWSVYSGQSLIHQFWCEYHFQPPILASLFFGEGFGIPNRNLFLKFDREVIVPSTGSIEVKLVNF